MTGREIRAGKPVKRSVAVAIFRDGRVLAVLRPDEPGEELPGVWGLPAASRQGDESAEECARRLGREKLGLSLTLGERLAGGRQKRPSYTLEMELYGATVTGAPRLPRRRTNSAGVTYYTDWRWAHPAALKPAAERGSLCARLLLRRLSSRE